MTAVMRSENRDEELRKPIIGTTPRRRHLNRGLKKEERVADC